MKVVVRTVLIGYAFALSSIIAAQEINPNLWQTSINRQFGFRLSYPIGWKLIQPKGPNVRLSVSPASGPGNCNVVVRPNAESKTMSQEELNKELDVMPMDDSSWSEYIGIPRSQFAIVERRRARIGSIPAIVGTLEASFETLEGRYFGKKTIAITITPGLVWSVTCGVSTYGVTEGRQRYEELYPYLMKVMGSFAFLLGTAN